MLQLSFRFRIPNNIYYVLTSLLLLQLSSFRGYISEPCAQARSQGFVVPENILGGDKTLGHGNPLRVHDASVFKKQPGKFANTE